MPASFAFSCLRGHGLTHTWVVQIHSCNSNTEQVLHSGDVTTKYETDIMFKIYLSYHKTSAASLLHSDVTNQYRHWPKICGKCLYPTYWCWFLTYDNDCCYFIDCLTCKRSPLPRQQVLASVSKVVVIVLMEHLYASVILCQTGTVTG